VDPHRLIPLIDLTLDSLSNTSYIALKAEERRGLSTMSEEVMTRREKTEKTKTLLRWAALFLGELRDGLTMVSFRIMKHVAPRPLHFYRLWY
jgi:hypothetical protein